MKKGSELVFHSFILIKGSMEGDKLLLLYNKIQCKCKQDKMGTISKHWFSIFLSTPGESSVVLYLGKCILEDLRMRKHSGVNWLNKYTHTHTH